MFEVSHTQPSTASTRTVYLLSSILYPQSRPVQERERKQLVPPSLPPSLPPSAAVPKSRPAEAVWVKKLAADESTARHSRGKDKK